MELGEEESRQKRQREMKSSFIHTVRIIINVYIQYLRGLLLSSETIERIHN